MNIKPIRNEDDHAVALARITALFASSPDTPDFDELVVLATLVDAYEREHYPIDLPSPLKAIAFAMDQGRFARSDLVAIMGSTAKVAEVLNGQRALSKAMIVRLHETYAIPYESLLSDLVHEQKKSEQARKGKVIAAPRAKAEVKHRRGTSKRKRKAAARSYANG